MTYFFYNKKGGARVRREDLKLYLVTDRSWVGEMSLESQIEEAIKGGVTIVQLREKNIDEKEFFKLASNVKLITDKYNVKLIINDNVEVAKEIDADGVHLGQGDMDILEARRILGDEKIIGISTKTMEQALDAEKKGADYLGVGAIFSTSTKLDAKSIDSEVFKNIYETIKIPIVAIGGISLENISLLRNTKISGVAVVSGILAQKDIKKAAMNLREEVEKI